jgi:hypothetical protein
MKVPDRLRHLRTDRFGRPVPYVNRWGDSDDPSRYSIAYDPHVRRQAVFIADYGDTPDFLHQSMQRQRECVMRGLCQVCARPVPWNRRLLVVSKISTEVVVENDVELRMITEPWLDPECAAFAIEKCPGLIRRRTAEDLVLVTADDPHRLQAVVSSGWLKGPLEEESRRVQPAFWCRIRILPVAKRCTADAHG